MMMKVSSNRAINMLKFNCPVPQPFASQQPSCQFELQFDLINQRRLSEDRFSDSDQSTQSPASSLNSSPDGLEFDLYRLDLDWNELFRRESAAVFNRHSENVLTNLVTAEADRLTGDELVRSIWQPTSGELEAKPNGLTDGSTNEFSPTAFENLMALADRTWSKLVRQMKSSRKKVTAKPSSNGAKGCKFCKNNLEPRSFYTSHSIKDPKGEVTCPILMRHVCEICGATGKTAHTRSYCPFSKVIRNSVDDVKLSYVFHNMKRLNNRD